MNRQPSDLAKGFRMGVIGGIAVVFIALVGMVEAFATRDIIGGVIDMGRVLVLVAIFMTGHFATLGGNPEGTRKNRVVRAGVAGVTSMAFLVLLVLLMTVEPAIRTIFVNATGVLLKQLTFGQDLAVGVVVLLLIGAVIGALPGLLQFLRPSLRQALVMATTWVITIGLLQELLTVTFQNAGPMNTLAVFLFAKSGLSVTGAIVTFIVIFGVELLRRERSEQVKQTYSALPATQQRVISGIGLLIALAILLSLPALLGLFFSEVLAQVGLFILMGLGLNIVVGFAGLLDLGYVAFFAVGAYTVGLLTSTSKEIVFAGGLPFWVGLPVAVVASFMGGVLLGIPVLKVRGDYLAIVTLGFGEIIRLLALSDFLKPYFAGARGLELIPKPFIGSFEFAGPQELYYLILIGCIIVAFIATRLKNSRIGRAWMAMREDEDVAQAMGIHLVATKLLAFAMGASFAGIGGAIFASKLAIIYPHSFNFLISINVLSLIIIGGMGSIPGVIVGGLVLVGLPELLREFADFRLLVYGAVLVVMMLVRPEGLIPEARRAMELEEFKEEGAVVAAPAK
ncbi:High-affinity branched-chain amino acid transport system permease protein LivH [Anaerolineae bacterium]|nr:High-affinity branched-chain amino acid transport system permease protein LivH [Anaerolineae bacterium]